MQMINDEMNDIEQLLNYVNPRQKEVLIMRFYKGLTYREIATHFGISPTRSQQIEREAIVKIHKEIEHQKLAKQYEENWREYWRKYPVIKEKIDHKLLQLTKQILKNKHKIALKNIGAGI